MDFDWLANPTEQRNGEFSAEVLAKLLKPRKQFIGLAQIIIEGWQAQRFERREYPLARLFSKSSIEHGIDGIDSNSDGDGFAMPNSIVAHCFKSVRTPVPEVKGTSCTALKRVASLDNVLQMAFGAFANDGTCRIHVAFTNSVCRFKDILKELNILEARDLHGLCEAAAPIAIIESL